MPSVGSPMRCRRRYVTFLTIGYIGGSLEDDRAAEDLVASRLFMRASFVPGSGLRVPTAEPVSRRGCR
jgi:hypothetical protein